MSIDSKCKYILGYDYLFGFIIQNIYINFMIN